MNTTLPDIFSDADLPSYDYTWEDLCSRPERFPLKPLYRIPERDKKTGPKANLPDGTMIRFSRIVARVGYEFGVHSVTRREWNEKGAEIAAKSADVSIETIKRVVCALILDAPFKGLKSEIYNALIRPLIAATPVETRNVRAMWFYDYKQSHQGQIIGRVKKLTGKRVEGCSSGGGWGAPSEWEPPYLSWSHAQTLYEVAPGFFNTGTVGNLLVYPADVTE